MQTYTSVNNADLSYWLALWRTNGIGPSKFQEILEAFPSLAVFFTASSATQKKFGVREKLVSIEEIGVQSDLAWLAESDNHHIITWQDSDYPKLLREISDPPPLLFIKGDAKLLSEPQIAIVGSRNPTRIGMEIAHDFARYLSAAGIVITSGFALGIDASSHQGALAGKGKTVAVFGTDITNIYPSRHAELAKQIVATGGALVSEFPIGTPSLAENFPRRNRVVSGLCLGTLVVEAALRSGSLITARLAAEQGREVFAIPGSIHNPLSKGCHRLIKQGAKLVETAGDILEELGPLMATLQTNFPAKNARQKPTKLDSEYTKLLECIDFAPTPADTLIERSGLTASAVASMLLILELQGHITAGPGGYEKIILK
jgi:DNA processing protein